MKHTTTLAAFPWTRLAITAVFAASLGACGGGSDGDAAPAASTSADVDADADAKALPTLEATTAATSCVDPTAAVSSNVRFAAPAGAGTGVVLSSNGTSVCFDGASPVAVHATVAVAQGASNYFYFEAKRSMPYQSGIGVSGTSPEHPSGADFIPTTDTVYAQGANTVSGRAGGGLNYGMVGTAETLGFAVDYRAKYPVVYVLAPASGNPDACPGVAPTALCVVSRLQLEGTTGKLDIYAWGVGGGTVNSGPKVSINTGNNLTTKPFAYPAADVRTALRTHWYQGDRSLNAQWPGATGPAASPTVTLSGHERVVLRQGDATPYRASLVVKTNSRNNVVRWSDETGALLGTGTSLPVTQALVNAWAPGEHRVTARATATSNRMAEVAYLVTVLASVANTDDDGDGLTFDQEEALRTDPGNPDTDADGLSDGAEQALGFNARSADSDRDGITDGLELATGPVAPRTKLVSETGTYATSSGIVLSNDGTQAAFTFDMNQDCLQAKAPFTDPIYQDPDFCFKRAVRANEGVKHGEFRYFETRRLGGVENLGHGLIARNAQIDPYCCFESRGQPEPPHPLTPPSMGVNSIGGVFVQLVLVPQWSEYPDYNPSLTVVQGFAVDYRGAEPVVHVVLTDSAGGMTISNAVPLSGFVGADAVPMIYGHPNLNDAPRTAVNMGLQKFHYSPDAIRAVLAARGVNMTGFAPGVGIHRWK